MLLLAFCTVALVAETYQSSVLTVDTSRSQMFSAQEKGAGHLDIVAQLAMVFSYSLNLPNIQCKLVLLMIVKN